ncbi:hypothetical protein CLV35_3682 [Motilibacter peucedani]|uniref:EamA-like transporter family protein n=1 Tax=Motilibacter peucedani TaxID=598650 RepID=A0A420XK88_9ACTN|nr:hypothetical protein [Motilibacter peucedani]RKS68554.1 hypothetical protein CLV35_3682 [Motilibacter peucedani]
MLLGLLAAVAAAVAFGVAALLQALSVRTEAATSVVDPRLLLRLLRHPAFAGALALNLVGFGLHFSALRTLPLFLAQTIIGSSVAVTALLAARVLGTALTFADRVAVVAVVTGLALIGGAAGDSGEVSSTVGQRAWLLAVTAGIVLAGAAAGRAPGRAEPLLLGFVAGCGFAVVAISARLLPSFAPSVVVRDPAAYALLLAGATAFLLYSAALQRGSAVTGTAAMVLSQTAGPALVGVLALGDEVRSGWAPVAVLGIALAGLGAVALARFDPQALAGQQPAPGPEPELRTPGAPRA